MTCKFNEKIRTVIALRVRGWTRDRVMRTKYDVDVM